MTAPVDLSLRKFCSLANLDHQPLADLAGPDTAWTSATTIDERDYAEQPTSPHDARPEALDVPQVTSEIVLGNPGEVVLALRDDRSVLVAEFGVIWASQTPVGVRRHGGAELVESGPDRSQRSLAVAQAVKALQVQRLARYRRCVRCAELNPPEWWHGDGYCQSCAERHLGVIH